MPTVVAIPKKCESAILCLPITLSSVKFTLNFENYLTLSQYFFLKINFFRDFSFSYGGGLHFIFRFLSNYLFLLSSVVRKNNKVVLLKSTSENKWCWKL
jgi:hypothetical protein